MSRVASPAPIAAGIAARASFSTLSWLLMLVLAAALSAGCDSMPGKPSKDDIPVRPSEIKDFASLYGTNCSGCHGDDGRLGPARSLNDAVYLALVSDDVLVNVIRDGVEGTAMPGFGDRTSGILTDDQIAILVSEMRKSWARPAETAGHEMPAYRAAPGDAGRGERAYARYCAACHGDDGTGGAKGGSVVDDSYLALVSDQGLRTTLIAGRTDLGMPDWRGDVGAGAASEMSARDVADITAWLIGKRVRFPGRPYAPEAAPAG